PSPPYTVGFAAETEKLREYAQQKLVDKKVDMIAANRVGEAGTGFDADDNALILFWADGERSLQRKSKRQLARELMAEIAQQISKR
ncbi:MAG: bifunctional 4'-phosphopantothenoylcysteine decarboxylase/phosphopantothenoylcysteine synthetase, partial [Gammaproteobacteria bacterium]|nr:bifunctional 4'-phosphopantothenoylcysteine decarboxylase/phosphopantothenoylcysteine synthetase [Gammaproteobacteria bacterium]